VVGFYGALSATDRPNRPNLVGNADQIKLPVLALFGGDDPNIPPADVAAFDAGLERAGVEHEIVTYPGAPHSFFDRKQEEFAEASTDAWTRVLDFLAVGPAAG
jgi:carboxymethylenebutenolidase